MKAVCFHLQGCLLLIPCRIGVCSTVNAGRCSHGSPWGKGRLLSVHWASMALTRPSWDFSSAWAMLRANPSPVLPQALPLGWASELCRRLLVSWMDPMDVHCSLSPAYLPHGLWTHVVALSMALSPFAPDSLFGPWIWFIACLVWDYWWTLLSPSSSAHHVQTGHGHPSVRALPRLGSPSAPGSPSLREQPALAAPWQLFFNPPKFKLVLTFLLPVSCP